MSEIIDNVTHCKMYSEGELRTELKRLLKQVCRVCETGTTRFQCRVVTPENGYSRYVIDVDYLEHRPGRIRQFFPVVISGPPQAAAGVWVTQGRKKLEAWFHAETPFGGTLQQELQKYAERFGFNEDEVTFSYR